MYSLIKYCSLIFFTFIVFVNATAQHVTLSGYIKDNANGEALIGASISTVINTQAKGTATNAYGYYSFSLPAGNHDILFSYLGYEDFILTINLTENKVMDIELKETTTTLKEIVVSTEKNNKNVSSLKMGYEKVEAKAVAKIPMILGEADVMKVLKFLPGVQSAGELSSGLSVRGGNKDQNLILLDEAPVYNASHMLGMFSVFNNDAIKSAEFYKGNIPIQYGGRIASLIDIRMQDGNTKRFSAKGGVGTISSRLTLEVPIVKDKGSLLIAGRRTYLDVFTKLSKNNEVKNAVFYFYDLNLKAHYKLGVRDKIYISGYFGKDVFGINGAEKFFFKWGNYTGTLRWNHIFSSKLFLNTSLITSNYNYNNSAKDRSKEGFEWKANLKDYGVRFDFKYVLNTNNEINFGLVSTHHSYQPGIVSFSTFDSVMITSKYTIPKNYALEHVLHLGNAQIISPNLSFNYGLRYSLFQNIGKTTVNNFDKNYKYKDSTVYGKGKIYKTFSGLEPRLGFNITLSDKNSIKASYSRGIQYLQQASNSTYGTPMDVWLPAGPNIKPQNAHLYSLGYYRNWLNDKVESVIEGYYSESKNQVDFKDFAELFQNDHIEGEMRFGKAKAYGIELMLRKKTGKLNGWISYTVSRSERTIQGINNNKAYLSPYDRTHNFNIVSIFDVSKRISISANWVYLTGNPFTAPVGRYYYENKVTPVYGNRNTDRLPATHRLDVGITINGKEKEGKRFKGSWNISVYNVYARKNPMQINFTQDETNPSKTIVRKMYVPIIPALSYNFTF